MRPLLTTDMNCDFLKLAGWVEVCLLLQPSDIIVITLIISRNCARKNQNQFSISLSFRILFIDKDCVSLQSKFSIYSKLPFLSFFLDSRMFLAGIRKITKTAIFIFYVKDYFSKTQVYKFFLTTPQEVKHHVTSYISNL